ncbi:MAG: hemolysin family protein [Alphaproteobacteria bacterium]
MAEETGQTDSLDGGRKQGLLFQLIRALSGRNGDSHLRDAFEELIEQHDDRETPIDPGERVLIANILKVGEMTAYDVMVPRVDIVGVDTKTPLEDLVQIMVKHPHSRYPVYTGVLDEILGMVHIKDVFAATTEKPDDFSLQTIMRKVLIIAPSMRVLDLLLQMRMTRQHMALVVDEYGGIDGLITIEDLVEEIVGEIEDEHDVETGPQIVERGDGIYLADARLPVEDLEARFGPILSDEERDDDIDTIGGLVFTLAGHVPSRGELIQHEESGVEFEVVDGDPRRIKRLRLRNLPVPSEETA